MRAYAVPAGVAVLTAAVLFPALDNAFYNDDALFLNVAGRVLQEPSTLFTERPLDYFRPVWIAYVTGLFSVFGLEPAGYFVSGALLHALASLLVYAVLARLLPGTGGRAAALAGATASCCLSSGAEATLWFSAHNTVLTAALALLSVLSWIRARERDRIPAYALAAAAAAAAVLSKEPGLVVLGWIAAFEAIAGRRAGRWTRRTWTGAALVLLAAVAAALPNERLLEGLTGSGGDASSLRAGAETLRADRILGALPWMFSPIRHGRDALAPVLGALLLSLLVALAAWRRGSCGRALLFGLAVLVTGMLTACLSLQQAQNGSRHYYLPAAGAALVVGALFHLAAGRASRPRRVVAVALLSLFCIAHAKQTHRLCREDYGPISRLQTRFIRSLEPFVTRDSTTLVAEPWIDNRAHLEQFAGLFLGVDGNRVRLLRIPRSQAQRTFSIWRDRGAAVLDCGPDGAVVPLGDTLPPTRVAAPGFPRRDLTRRDREIRFAKILPP